MTLISCHMITLKICFWDLRDGSVRKVFPISAWRLSPQALIKKVQAGWHNSVIPEMGRQRQADLWGLLASQPAPLGKFQANERFCLNKQVWQLLRNSTWSYLLVFTHICTYAHSNTHTEIHSHTHMHKK